MSSSTRLTYICLGVNSLNMKAPMKHKKLDKGAVVNPFDKFSNSKKKHEVLNRRVKGEDRNVGRALARAVEVRKNRLLTDYNKNKKSSSFVDKRFGENDMTLTLEDKMLARFQKERLKKSRNSSIFNLDANDANENMLQLTHKGQVLTDNNFGDNDWSSDDDENDTLGKDLVNQLHFGGGMVPKSNDSRMGDHMTALQEIVAKSKMYKQQKKDLKAEIEEETDKVDTDFQSLLNSSLVEFRDGYDSKTKKNRRQNNDDKDDFDDYDKAFHQMSYEAKVQPSDRTKSLEEIALANREKIDQLEKKRLDRMKQGYDPTKDEDDDNENSRRNKRKKHMTNKKPRVLTDDDIEDFYSQENDENEEIDNEEEEDDNEDEGDDDDEDEDEDEGEEKDEEEEHDDNEEEEDIEDNDELEADDDDDDDNVDELDVDDDESGLYNENDDDDDDDDVEMNVKIPLITKSKSLQNSTNQEQKQEYIPHKILCPNDIEAFDALLNKYCKSPLDAMVIIDRILLYNSVHLPGLLGIENKKNMTVFLDILLIHFIRVADSLAIDRREGNEVDLIQPQVIFYSILLIIIL